MKQYGSRRNDNNDGNHGEKSSRARTFREALDECQCVHGISLTKSCMDCIEDWLNESIFSDDL